MQFTKFFSLDSPKAIKARSYGYLNAINYMAPHRSAGVGDLCGNASPGCIALCLGVHSGAATYYPAVMRSRIVKARMFMKDRKAFLEELRCGIRASGRAAIRQGLKLCVRLNGATDIAWEGVAPELFRDFFDIQFVDYTKSVKRALAHARGELPSNYHLTFSRSETNEADCLRVLEAGGNVVVVFSPEMKTRVLCWGYLGTEAIDGDLHDLRHLEGRQGLVIALSPKGARAKHDRSGFVVR